MATLARVGVAVLLLSMPGSALAQLPPRASVTVIVTLGDGGPPAAGASVALVRILDDQELRRVTDAEGVCRITDVAAGAYEVRATLGGLKARPARVVLSIGEASSVTLPLVAEEAVQVRAPDRSETAATSSATLRADLTERAPVKDEVASLLPLLPGVVRSTDGRIQMKGGQATQGGFQIDGTTSVDPSTGDLALTLPSAAVESVTLHANPFAAEFGRFTSAVAEVQTRQGGDKWRVTPNSFVPRLRLSRDGEWTPSLRSWTPRLALGGPLLPDRLFVATSVHYRYVETPLHDLPGEPTIDLQGLDLYNRFDTGPISNHRLTVAQALFPQTTEYANLDTWNPRDVTYTLRRRGYALAVSDRAVFGSALFESTASASRHDTDVDGEGEQAMSLAPGGRRGNYFNSQRRRTLTVQSVSSVSVTANGPGGEHLIKAGFDVMHSGYDGTSVSRPIHVTRSDGSLSRSIEFDGATRQDVSGTDLAVFVQDRWQASQRVSVELGLRLDRDGVTSDLVSSPRAGIAITTEPGGRGVLRGGVGVFRQRTPLNVAAFASYERRTETSFGADGITAVGTPITFDHQASELSVPGAVVWNVEFVRAVGRALTLKAGHLQRFGSRQLVLEPSVAGDRGLLRLVSDGRSRYWEQELTARYAPAARQEMLVSYVASRSHADLNNFDVYFGTAREPVLQPNSYGPANTDVPHRLLVRGTIGLPSKWDLQPVLEVRTGFPYSQVSEDQAIVGAQNGAGRFPTLATLDLAIQRPVTIYRWRLRVGVRTFNALNRFTPRDVQNNRDAATYGRFFNSIGRSIGATFWIDR